MLFVAAVSLRREIESLPGKLPVLRLWFEPDAQQRAILGVVYEFLRDADELLPPGAPVLLLTAGDDVRHREYMAFHRALYFLTPRPVWWLNPAPPDGSWESRWWISRPLAAEEILAVAREKGAVHLLAFELSSLPPLGGTITELPGGALVALAGDSRAESRAVYSVRSPSVSLPPRFWPLRLAASVLVIVLLGDAVVAAVLGHGAVGVERAALAWLLGAGVTAVAMLWLNAVGATLDGQVKILTLAAVAACLARWRGGGRSDGAQRPGADAASNRCIEGHVTGVAAPLLSALCIGCLGASFALVAVDAVGRPLSVWDSWVLWGMRSRAIFASAGITSVIYADPSRAVTLPDYPLLLPSLQAWIYAWVGAADDRLAGVPSLLFFAALPAVACAALRRRGADRAFALLTSATLAASPSLLRLAGDVFADLPVACLATVAAIYLMEWLAGGRGGVLLVAALAAGLLSYTKREGIVLAGALSITTLSIGPARRRAWTGALAVGASALVVGGAWKTFVAFHGSADLQFEAVTPAHLLANLGRSPSIAWRMLQALLSPRTAWLFPATVVFATLCRKGRGDTATAILPGAAILYLALLASAFFFSAYVPYQQHMASSYYRIVAQVSPLLVLWIGYRGAPAAPIRVEEWTDARIRRRSERP
jgi:hypothetical protein